MSVHDDDSKPGPPSSQDGVCVNASPLEGTGTIRSTTPHRTLLTALVSVILLSGLPASAWGQGATPCDTESTPSASQSPACNPETARNPELMPRPVAHATRIDQPIVIDGKLDEPIWASADSLDRFIQSQPDAGLAATERTVVRIMYDDRNLYVGGMLYDSDPDAMVISTLEKDFPGESTRDYDIFSITLDTFHDRKNSFIYLVNPMGAVRDGQTYDDSRDTNFSWNGVHHVRTRIEDWGWSVEMAIPWSSIRFDPSVQDQEWGFNILRRVRRKNEDSYWAPMDRRDPVHRMSKAGTLEGLSGLRGSRNLMVTPYISAAATSVGPTSSPDRDGTMDGGMDLKYGVTPKLTLDLTYRTDFSQVEVDQEQVNLTRFSLFFPEKRDFFVENSGVFTFGDVTEREYRMGASLRDFTLFHSRRIGLDDGRPIPIVGGGRLTGRVGGFEVGVLDMQTGHDGDSGRENFAVARVRRNVGGVDVGGIIVNRQETDGGGGFNRSWGFDATARPLGGLILSSYVAGTDQSGEKGEDRMAARLTAAWRDRLWDISAMYKQVGEGFNPGVGYIRRTGMRQGYATVGAHPRPAMALLQTINPYVEVDYIASPTGLLQTRTGSAGMGFEFRDGSTMSTLISDRFERLDAPFAVTGGAEVPEGSYAFREGSVSYTSSQGRSVSGNVSVSGGGFFDGSRRSVGMGLNWRASYRMTLELRADHNEISMPDQDFTADLYGARLRYSHSTTLFGSAFVQYNEALDQLVTNLRVNLIHAPLSNVFLVYTERRDLGGDIAERQIAMKVTRMLAF